MPRYLDKPLLLPRYLDKPLFCEESVPLALVAGENLVEELAPAGLQRDVPGQVLHRAQHNQLAHI